MRSPRGLAIIPVAIAAVLPCIGCDGGPVPAAGAPTTLRVATFNIRELSADRLTAVDSRGTGLDPQATAAALVIREARPDVLILNEIDFDWERADDPALNARRFADAYLASGSDPLVYPYAYAAPSNTGLLTGLDLNGDGVVATDADRGTREHGDDAYGFGTYPGQYAMAVLSRFPLLDEGARTFQRFRWADLPGHHMPAGHFPPAVAEEYRLSSKSHWDLPVVVGRDTLRLWVSHPTPPAFDGPEDRNGRRNFDEIRFWVLYLEGDSGLVDDTGVAGGYRSGAPFIIAGDLNARPGDTTVTYDGVSAIEQLLDHPGIQDPDPANRPTATWLDGVRVDYVLPSADLDVTGFGVVDPDAGANPTLARAARAASDHRLVWVDVAWPPGRAAETR